MRIKHTGRRRTRLAAIASTLVILLLLPGFAQAAIIPEWIQFGGRVDGEAPGDRFGSSLAMTGDGTAIVVGAPANDNGGRSAGHVRVLRNDGAGWQQVGSDIDGDSASDRAGFSVAISDDGLTIVVGAPYSDPATGLTAGRARVYRFDGRDWRQVGADIIGDTIYDQMGRTVAVSSDGGVVAVAALQALRTRGHVKVFAVDGDELIQLGSNIDGDRINDWSGSALALSDDGITLAIGAAENDGNGLDSGQVRVFQFDGSQWNLLGADIDGEGLRDHFGSSVAMSADGLTFAAGARYNDGNGSWSGHVRAYRFDGAAWNQLGADIDGEAANDLSGSSLAMSAAGTRLVVGAPNNDGFRNRAGHVRVYDFDGTSWNQVWNDIDGRAANDYFGSSVAITDDGSTIAVGAAQRNELRSGYVATYALGDAESNPALRDGNVVFLTNFASGRLLDGDPVHRQWNVDTAPEGRFDTRWKLRDNGDGTWSLLNQQRKRYLDADGPGAEWNVGLSILLAADDRWQIEALDDGSYALRNVFFDRYLHEDADRNVDTIVGHEGAELAAKWLISPKPGGG